MLVLATSILVTAARKNVVKIIETVKTVMAGENSEYPRTNLAQVLFIWYSDTF